MAHLREEQIAKKYPLRSQLKDLWFYVKGYRFKLVFFLCLSVLASLLGLLPAYLYGRIIDFLTTGSYDHVYWFLFICGLAYVMFHLIRNIVIYKTKILSSFIRNQAKVFTFSHMLSLSLAYYEDHPLGMILHRINAGGNALKNFIKDLYRSMLIDLFGIFFALVFLMIANLVVGVFALILVIVFLIYSYNASNRLINLENKVKLESESVYSKVLDFFSHIKIVKLLNIQDVLIKKLNSSLLNVVKRERVSRAYERKKVALSSTLIDLSSVFALAYLAYLVIGQNMTVGIAVMLYGFFIKLVKNTEKISGKYHMSLYGRVAMYRMHLFYKVKPKIKEPKRKWNWGGLLGLCWT